MDFMNIGELQILKLFSEKSELIISGDESKIKTELHSLKRYCIRKDILSVKDGTSFLSHVFFQ